MFLGIVGWILCGIVLGFIATKLVDLHGDDPLIDVVLCAAGALIGGGLYSFISGSNVSAFNIWSLIWAAVAAVMVLVIWHFIRSGGKHDRPSVRRSY